MILLSLTFIRYGEQICIIINVGYVKISIYMILNYPEYKMAQGLEVFLDKSFYQEVGAPSRKSIRN